MDGETVEKEALQEGGSHAVPVSDEKTGAIQSTGVPAVPGGDGHPASQPDLVREPQGDPTGVAGGDGYPASRLGSRPDAQGDRTDVGTGRAFPPSRMDPALELTWHPRGPQGAKHKAEMGRSSQRSSEVLKEILQELHKAPHEMDGETVEKEALQEGGSHAVPVSDEKTGAIQSTGVPAVPGGDGHPASQPDLVREPQGDPTGVAGGDGYPASRLGSRPDAQGDRTDVGTGRAFPPSRMDPALELTWHPRGPQGAKHKAEMGRSSQRSSEVLKEILQELHKAPHEMDGETVEKEALQEGGSHAVPVSDEKTGAIQSTGVPAVPGGDGHPASQPDLVREPQGDPTGVAGGDGYPASRLGSRPDAQGDRTDVGTGRAFPPSRMDPALELTWHPRGPQRAKHKAEMGRSSQRSSEVLKEILQELHKAPHEMDGETVEKEALQEGGSHAVPVSDEKTGAIQSTGVPAVPGGDGHPASQPDLVREPQGDPTGVAGGDGYPASRLGSRPDAQGDRTDVGTGRAFPPSRMDPALELTWHPRGPQGAKHKAEMGRSSQRSSEVLKEILQELHKAPHEMDGETVEKEALQEGGSHAVPVSDEKTGAIQSTGVPVLSNPGEAHRAGIYEFFRKNPGVDGKRNTNATDPKDFQKYCIEGAVAVLGSMLLGMALCCVICLWRKRKQRLSAASGARPDTSSCPSHPDSWTDRPSTSESWTRHQQPSPVPGKPARLPRGPREGPAPTSPGSRPARPPPPKLSWLSNSASRLSRDQPSTLQPPEERKPPPRPPSPLPRPS
ncbi:uncharacterized protein M6G45_014932 [Spheniscus humboldti]